MTVQTRLLDEGLASRTDEDLEAALAEVAEARLADLGERATCERSRAHVEPETTRAQLEVAGRALEAALDEGRQLDRDIAVVEGELRGVGDEGVGERLAAAEVRLEAARQHLERVRREAGAWKLLYEELSAAATATREALLAPVVARLTPWLGRLLPGVEPVLDPDTLAPIELRRGSRTEALTHLSHGTREQIAVLVRLGLAQLLNEREGEAPCIILDDALVYADENRFDTMKAIIQVAAADLQIIILTCRPRDYRGLTGRHVRLEECRG